MPTALLDRVAVVTVSYNSSAQLPGFLDSVAALSPRPRHVVIVDNASSDAAASQAIAAGHGAVLLRLQRNVGYGGAVNEGVRALPRDVEYVLVSNPDVSLTPDSVGILVAAADRNARAGAIGPRILNPDGTTYPSARSVPSLRTGVGHAVFGHPWPTNPWTRSYRGERATASEQRTAGWLSGSCFLVRRSAFDDVGGFDEGYFMYFEDVDLGYRLGLAGWTNLYEPSAAATHVGGLSTRTESTRMLRAHHESAIRFIRRKYSARGLAPVRWALTAGLRLRLWLLARRGS